MFSAQLAAYYALRKLETLQITHTTCSFLSLGVVLLQIYFLSRRVVSHNVAKSRDTQILKARMFLYS